MVENTVKHEIFEWIKALLVALILAWILRSLVIQPYRVEGSSMEANLHDGERLFINRLVHRLRPPQRGEVVVVDLPDEDITIIKRIVGLPGESVEIKDDAVYIDGQALSEPYLTQTTQGVYERVQIPAGHFFVLGDNRGDSRDSRSMSVGFVAAKQIKGQAVCIYWPLASMRLLR